jgi:16S rRNA (cytidine1402-2'-O)-methyltransferase
VSNDQGILYVVATPIGNLGDISQRALETLRNVDLIAAEDTRQTRILLQRYEISVPLVAYQEHNEAEMAPRLAREIRDGRRLALVSDAGTPLVSDPGYRLIREVRDLGLAVVPVPGACALVCALSAAGLATDRFLFAGFPPRTQIKRRAWFAALTAEPGTLAFYESSHRILETLQDVAAVFGSERRVVLARELTKVHETFLEGSAEVLAARLTADPQQCLGEHVLLVARAGHGAAELDAQTERLLRELLQELPLKQAVSLAARISGARKNQLYRLAMAVSGAAPGTEQAP